VFLAEFNEYNQVKEGETGGPCDTSESGVHIGLQLERSSRGALTRT
jgi:hypothetical protein